MLTCAVFGCADIARVPNAVVRRHGNTAVVKCTYSGQTYLLTCTGNRWKGDLANCSKGASLLGAESLPLQAIPTIPTIKVAW